VTFAVDWFGSNEKIAGYRLLPLREKVPERGGRRMDGGGAAHTGLIALKPFELLEADFECTQGTESA